VTERHDTPVDLLPVVSPAAAAGAEALLTLRALEDLEANYEAWRSLRLEQAGARLKFKAELRELDVQGELILGAVRAAGPTGAEGGAALSSYAEDTRARLEAARTGLERRWREAEATFEAALTELRCQLVERVARRVELVKPRVGLMVRALPRAQRILHAQRLGADEAVLLQYVLSGRIPTRYGALFDDSTDDVTQAPPVVYAEEGLSEVRLPAAALVAWLASQPQVWPVKGCLPYPVSLASGPTWARWLERGPVMELELLDGDGWRNLLSQPEAEQLTGHLLRLKLEERLELELVRG
jgi:hypothetical protein